MYIQQRAMSRSGNQTVRMVLACCAVWVSLAAQADAPPRPKQVVGWIEKVAIAEGMVQVHAKIDSGADHSSLNAPEIENFTKDGEDWVRFKVADRDGRETTLERPVVRVAKVKRKGCGSQTRPVVRLDLCLGRVYKQVEVNLVDRSSFSYQMLIGRSFLRNRFLVDSAERYRVAPACEYPAAARAAD